MKLFITILIIGSFVLAGFSQMQVSASSAKKDLEKGPKMEQIKSEKNGDITMPLSKTKTKTISSKPLSGTNVSVKVMENRGIKPSSAVTKTAVTIQNKTTGNHTNYRRISGREFHHTKAGKKLNRVEGIAPREVMTKIEHHSQITNEVLLQALGTAKSVKSRTTKIK